MKKSSFQNKPRKPLKRSPFKQKAPFKRVTRKTGTKRKYKKKTPLQLLQTKCDSLLTPIAKKNSESCLLNGYEGCTYYTNVGHHHLKKSTSASCRYYIPNIISLCTFCHCRLHNDEILWTGRVVEIMGFDWLHDLEEKKKETVKISQTYYKEHLERLEKLI